MEPPKLPLLILRTLKRQQRMQRKPTPRLPHKPCGGVDQLLPPFSLPFWYSEGSKLLYHENLLFFFSPFLYLTFILANSLYS
jgi:hypothetical protein